MASNNFYDSDSVDFGTRPPFFDGEKYYIWKNRMQIFVNAVDFHAWRAIKNGPFVPTQIVDGLTKEKPRSEWTDDDKKKVHSDSRAKHFISCALSNDEFSYVMNCDTAQEMWNTLRDFHEGTGKVKMARIQYLIGEYEVFSMKPSENIRDMQMRFYDVVNHLASLGEEIPNEDLVNKVLRCLSKKWTDKVITITTLRDLKTVLLVSLFSELRVHELKLNRFDENDEMHKKKKNSARVAALLRKKSDEDDDLDSDNFGTRPPLFDGEKYYIWKNRMQIFVNAVDFHAWRAIKNGPFVPTQIVDGLTKEKSRSEWTDDDKKKVHSDSRAKHFISCALSNDEFSYVMNCDTAQEMWNTLRDFHEGTGKVKMARIQYLIGEYEVFSMKPGENIRDMKMRFYDVVNHLASLGEEISNEDLVNKVLRCLSKKWTDKVITIRTWRDLKTMLLVSLFSELRVHELKLNRLDENDEMHKKKKNNVRVAVSSRKKDDEDDDSDDSEG